MKSLLALLSPFVLPFALTGCGFDCTVQGEKQAFPNCEALQQAYDAEQSSLAGPVDNAVLDDLDTCGAANGCNLEP